MADNISKIRNEILTEDEKMETIADYLENGGGGGGSSKLRVKVNVDYVPTSAAEIVDMSGTVAVPQNSFAYVAQTGVSFEDEDGNAVSLGDVKKAIEDGSLEIVTIDHLAGVAAISGGSVTLTDTPISFHSLPATSSSVSSNGAVMTSAFGTALAPDMPLTIPFGISIITVGGNTSAAAYIGVVKTQ